ncbi:hypothetical protein E1263_12565 [Kribbella antibiotica]|uniref:Uncharacterized protein n=1 Tax=Kribbella antibiotica TaxID=190195 RepID=A0A4R4ZSU1_9ACTN|nr:hypothetical protein [Kribbella antibiotica]TDD60082.1 hypothetical protein E1263_12565 [Kribbella antibiotica]
MVNIIKKPNSNSAAALTCAPIPGASLRLHGMSVVVLAVGTAQFTGGAVGDVKYGNSGSRAWSPPV